MKFDQKIFLENELVIKNKKIKYYLSPNLLNNNFKHAFFTKGSSEINLGDLSKHLNPKNHICVLNQVHSNQIVFGSTTKQHRSREGDGIICDKNDQSLWIYTADCMPILFADKRKRFVAAVHCGRKGLENRIIKNVLRFFDNLETSKTDLLVAIGPSISQKYYLIDRKTLREFYKKVNYEESMQCHEDTRISLPVENLFQLNKNPSIHLDLKRYAHIQLLNENIPNANIDISWLCTYESIHDFHSWRRSKTSSRQWSFISA